MNQPSELAALLGQYLWQFYAVWVLAGAMLFLAVFGVIMHRYKAKYRRSLAEAKSLESNVLDIWLSERVPDEQEINALLRSLERHDDTSLLLIGNAVAEHVMKPSYVHFLYKKVMGEGVNTRQTLEHWLGASPVGSRPVNVQRSEATLVGQSLTFADRRLVYSGARRRVRARMASLLKTLHPMVRHNRSERLLSLAGLMSELTELQFLQRSVTARVVFASDASMALVSARSQGFERVLDKMASELGL
ncbi:hypothetical protein ACP3V3_16830 [Vibrio sp. PNB22_3_1]